MDDIVRQAMAKWPNVPAVFGWLSLNRRGAWLIRDESISNPMLIDFIGRNYDRDEAGRWFFQNGPQRVFVKLDYAPWVLRTTEQMALVTHTGRAVDAVSAVWLDEDGIVVIETEHGPGVLDDRDTEAVSARFVSPDGHSLEEDALLEAIERIVAGGDGPLAFTYHGRSVPLRSLASCHVPARLGFVRDPQPNSDSA